MGAGCGGRLSGGDVSTDLLSGIAPTAIDEDGRANTGKNPGILDYLLRGTVHDTTSRRMGGVAGHAGVFSTAHDVSIFAQALLDRLAGRPSEFPSTQATFELMTTPQQPGHSAEQLQAANDAPRAADRSRTIRRSRAKTCAVLAGTSIPTFPCREASSFRSGALATRASPG